MKNILTLITANLISFSFIALAGYLAMHDKEGWGWCIFGALVTAHTYKSNTKEIE